MRKYLTPEQCQLLFECGLWKLKKGPNGCDEIDSWLVLVHGTVKYLVGQFKVNKTTVQPYI